jgi:hypothetical protein
LEPVTARGAVGDALLLTEADTDALVDGAALVVGVGDVFVTCSATSFAVEEVSVAVPSVREPVGLYVVVQPATAVSVTV